MRISLLFQTVFLLFFFEKSFSQNVMLNVVTQNAGIVKIDSTIFFEVTVSNTSSTTQISAYKLRPQISFPNEFVSVQETEFVLPKGWTIVSNKKGVVVLSNGTDKIDLHDSRTILISFKGNKLGGPFTIIGNLMFSNGIAPGSAAGVATVGDILADNISTSTVMVVK